MRQFFKTLGSYRKSLGIALVTSLLPYLGGLLRDTLVGEVIGHIWRFMGWPQTLDQFLGVMSANPLRSMVFAAVVWVCVSAWRSERHVKTASAQANQVGVTEAPTKTKGDPIQHDRSAPKRFSVYGARELLRKGRDASPRERKTTIDPQVGMWIEIEGIATSIEDDYGDDGMGGKWAGFEVNVAEHKKGNVLPEMPLVYKLLFYGDDAKAVRALPEKQWIKAVGQIKSLDYGFGASILCPCELVSYGSPAIGEPKKADPIRPNNNPQPASQAGRPIEVRPAASLSDGGTIPVELNWGGSMSFKGVSDSADMLSAVKCTLIDARLYLPKHGWVAAEDTHANGAFRQQLEVGKADMYCQQPIRFGSLANEHHRVSIQGNPVGGGGVDHCRITMKGIRRLEFSIQDASGRTARAFLCFKWAGEGHAPEPLNCSDVDPMPPPIQTESLGAKNG